MLAVPGPIPVGGGRVEIPGHRIGLAVEAGRERIRDGLSQPKIPAFNDKDLPEDRSGIIIRPVVRKRRSISNRPEKNPIRVILVGHNDRLTIPTIIH